MNKVVLYLMNKKGYTVLNDFINNVGKEHIELVISCEDKNVEKDYFDDIESLCFNYDIRFEHRRNVETISFSFNILKIAIGWRWLIKNSDNLIVLHDSILPKYRGFAPLVAALLNGDNNIGITALEASDDYDTGAIILQKAIHVDYPITISTLIDKICILYSQTVIELFELWINNNIKAKQQDESSATYSLWRDTSDYFIDWNLNADYIERKVDALGFPYLGAKAKLDNHVVHIKKVDVGKDVYIEHRKDSIGKVIFCKEGLPYVVCGSGIIIIKEMVSVESGNSMLPLNKIRCRFK